MSLFSRKKSDPQAPDVEEIIASRRTIVEAYEVERRRIERDLHDGAQQYLVAATITLGEALLSPELNTETRQLLAQTQQNLEGALAALRTTVRGIHPQVLIDSGLVAALNEVISHGTTDVKLICHDPIPKIPVGVLSCAYFFCTECLTNVAKYCPEAKVTILITTGEYLRISIVDNGPGGAHIKKRGGLSGMRERLAAVGGDLEISSPPGGPTKLVASIPLLLYRNEPGIVIE